MDETAGLEILEQRPVAVLCTVHRMRIGLAARESSRRLLIPLSSPCPLPNRLIRCARHAPVNGPALKDDPMTPTGDTERPIDEKLNGRDSAPVRSPGGDDTEIPDAGFAWSTARVLGAMAFGLMAIFWTWAFIRGTGVPHPDELDLPRSESAADIAAASPDQRAALTFLNTSEAICAAAQADIATLPLAITAESFDARADVVDEATGRLARMVDDLMQVDKPTEANEHMITTEWLGDYDRFLGDRREYAATLRTGIDPPFLISARDGRRITDYIVNFAEVNRMYSCVPPGDVG